MNCARTIANIVSPALIVALLTGGCATRQLWEERPYHPSANPGLQLSLDPGREDVLVQYREQFADSKKLRSRAYWLFDSANSIAFRNKPVFVKPKASAGLIPIPLCEHEPATNTSPPAGLIAVPTAAQQGFNLWQNGDSLGRFDLPIYLGPPPKTGWRIIVTPFAALQDTVVIVAASAAVIAVVIAYFYLESQTNQ